jgi:hypothetical protein
MKPFLRTSVVICLVVFGLNAFSFAQGNFLITPDSVGDLKIGMTVAEARKALPRHVFSRTSDGEGIALIEAAIRNRTHFLLYANEFDPAQPIDNNAKIVFIEIVNPAYRTEQGVHPNMLLSEVEKLYGKLQSIVLSEIESREYARFATQPLGIDLKVLSRTGQAGIYAGGAMRADRYTRTAYVGSVILLGRSGGETPVETGFTSRYTNLATQCRTPEGQGEEGGHISTYCEGFGGYRVHIFDTATTMEINVQAEDDEGGSVSIASQSLGFDMKNKQIEWRFRDGKPFAVIMRADEYRLGDDGLIRYPVRKTGEFLVVKGLPGFEGIDHRINTRANPDANEEARKMADEGFAKGGGTTGGTFEKLDIAPFNRMIANASRQNQAWVRSPMETAAKIAGEFEEMGSRTIEMKYPTAEGGDTMTVTVTNEGLLDDSVRAERFVFNLSKNANGVWRVDAAQKSWACRPNRGHENFSAAPCI